LVKKDKKDDETNNADKTKNNTNRQKEKENIETMNIDYLIIGDSNTKKIKTNILNKNCSTKRIYRPLLSDIVECIEKMKIMIQPKKILIHCGCNDVDKYKQDTLKVIYDLEQVVASMRRKFPNSTIVIYNYQFYVMLYTNFLTCFFVYS
jgi:hypothetical protein